MIILHVTTDTNYGGVQETILGLCRFSMTHGTGIQHHVLRIRAGKLEEKFQRFCTLHYAGENYENAVPVLRQIHPDIVHLHMPGARFPAYAEEIAAAGVPVVENVHCVNPATPREEEVMAARIVNSQYVYSLQQSKQNLHTIPHAVDPDSWAELESPEAREMVRNLRQKEFGIGPDTIAIGRIGNITPWKKVADFVHAVPAILREIGGGGPPLAFFLAGATHESPRHATTILDLADMLFVRDKIRFLWNLQNKFAYLAMLDIFLYPTSREGYCIAVIEAMSLGLPVVTYRDSAMPETVPAEAGEIVPAGDIQGLARAVVSLIKDPKMLKMKSAAAREVVIRRNMPEAVFPQYEKIYRQCAS